MKFNDPLHVSGVVKDPPANSTIKFDIVFNYDLMLENDENSGGWRSTYADTYVILKKEQKLVSLKKRLQVSLD